MISNIVYNSIDDFSKNVKNNYKITIFVDNEDDMK